MRTHLRNTYFILFSILLISACSQGFKKGKAGKYAPFQYRNDKNIKALMDEMTLDQKVAQLLLVQTELKDNTDFDTLKTLLQQYEIGGLMFDKVNEKYHSYWIDSLQKFSKTPFLNGVMPNTHISDFLSTTSLGWYSVGSDSLILEMIEKRLNTYRRLGVQLNFEADVSTINQLTEVINDSLFTLEQMAALAKNNLIINTYQQKGILVGLHDFSEYHVATQNYLVYADSILLPHFNLVTTGLSAMLLDTNTFFLDTLKTFKTNGVRQYLGDSLEFGGLAISYGSNPKRLREQLRTGSDAFIVSLEALPEAFAILKKAVEKGVITEGMLNFSVEKILQAKSWANKYESQTDTIAPSLKETMPYDIKIFEASTVVAKDDNNILPLKNINDKQVLIANFNDFALDDNSFINHGMKLIAHPLEEPKDDNQLNLSLDINLIKKYDYTIITILQPEKNAQKIRKELEKIKPENRKNVIIYYVGHPKFLKIANDFPTVIYQPANTHLSNLLAPEVILGGIAAKGQVPMTVSKSFFFGTGKTINAPIRLKRLQPESVGIAAADLTKIDAIVKEGIQGKAMPSCQVLVAKNGNIIYDKAFGYHTYNQKTKVNRQHLYDLASVTKVISTTMAMMKLYQQGKYALSDSLYQIFGKDSLSNVDYVTVKELMIHTSGLPANMPILRYYHNKKKENFYTVSPQNNASAKIANNFYLIDGWVDTLWKEMKALPIGTKTYKYSDVNANILQRIVEKITQKRLDEYVYDYYYNPLDMTRTLYNPLEKFDKKEVVPTEQDNYWRRQLVHGYVHDESAALQGGIAGNAGLFSTTNDLAIISQMLLNGGKYGGRRYLQPQTINLFTASTHGNHRGLGFNKQTTDGATGCADVAPLGFFAIKVVASLQNTCGLDTGATLNAAIILAMMAIHVIVSVAEDSLVGSVERMREASYALATSGLRHC